MHKLISLAFLSFILSSEAFEVSLKEVKDLQDHYWKFSKRHAFTYFNSTNEIHNSFIPLSPEKIPERNGVWVIRHKDFLEIPSSLDFEEISNRGNAFIEYSTHALFFQSVKIRAFFYGDVSIHLTANTRNINGTNIEIESKMYEECVENGPATGNFEWATFEIQFPDTATMMELEIALEHKKSFLIIDELIVSMAPFEDEAVNKAMAYQRKYHRHSRMRARNHPDFNENEDKFGVSEENEENKQIKGGKQGNLEEDALFKPTKIPNVRCHVG